MYHSVCLMLCIVCAHLRSKRNKSLPCLCSGSVPVNPAAQFTTLSTHDSEVWDDQPVQVAQPVRCLMPVTGSLLVVSLDNLQGCRNSLFNPHALLFQLTPRGGRTARGTIPAHAHAPLPTMSHHELTCFLPKISANMSIGTFVRRRYLIMERTKRQA